MEGYSYLTIYLVPCTSVGVTWKFPQNIMQPNVNTPSKLSGVNNSLESIPFQKDTASKKNFSLVTDSLCKHCGPMEWN